MRQYFNTSTLQHSKSVFASLGVLILLLIIASTRYPHFFSGQVFLNLLRDNAFFGIVAIGMTFVILTGGIDLSVGAMVGFSSILSAKLIETLHWPAFAAIATTLTIGAIFGTGAGLIISRFRIPPFLVTLAGMFLLRGLAFVISLQSIAIDDPLYQKIGDQPYDQPIAFLVVLAAAYYLLTQRPFGKNVYAVGGNEMSAKLLGVPNQQTTMAVYAISGLCAALGGIAYSFYTTSGNPNAGTLMELDAIAAVVIGGTLLTGGVGSLFGTVVGVLILGVIQTAITFEGTLSSWWAKVATGVLLLLFVLPQKVFARAPT